MYKEQIIEAQNGSENALAFIVKKYTPLAISIASQFKIEGLCPIEDLIQEGIIGLCIAVKKYDTTSMATFGVYSKFWVKKYISKYAQANRSSIYVPTNLSYKIGAYKKGLGEGETHEQLMGRLKMSDGEYKCMLEMPSTQSFGSFVEESSYFCGKDDVEGNMLLSATRDDIANALGVLGEVDRKLIILRFGLGCMPMTYRQLGVEFGMTYQYAQNRVAKSLKKLKHYLK